MSFDFTTAYALAVGTELIVSGSPYSFTAEIFSKDADYDSTGVRAILFVGEESTFTTPEGEEFTKVPTYIVLETMTEQLFELVTSINEVTTPDYTALNAALKAEAVAKAEEQNATYVSTLAKPYIYARKMSEMEAWALLTDNDKEALSTDERIAQFPFLYFDAVAFGDTMTEAYNRFYSGTITSVPNLAQIEASIQKAYYDSLQAIATEDRVAAVEDVTLTTVTQGLWLTEDGDTIITEDGDYFTL